MADGTVVLSAPAQRTTGAAVSPLKVLHRLWKLDPGGIETWLLNLARVKPKDLQFDFVVEERGGRYEEEVGRFGCRVLCLDHTSRFGKRLGVAGFARRDQGLDRVLAAGHYDVFHIHGEEFMGDALKLAAEAGVPVRVAHCHNTVLARGKRNPEMALRAARFRTTDRRLILKYATDICAVSNEAGRFLMGNHWEADVRCRPLYCGVALDQFSRAAEITDTAAYRADLGVPRNGIVVGHAGSMGPSRQKNHSFLLEVFDVLARRDPRWFLYLVGDGPLRPVIERDVTLRGLEERVSMRGFSKDVPGLMTHTFDVLLLPSLQEGLPIVGLEAVAAGLYTVCSDTITRDFTNRFQDRVTAISLKASPAQWADHVETAVKKRVPPTEGIAIIEDSPFSIEASLGAMVDLYRNRLAVPPQPRC
jgi:glycosyltransferase involved in cell wall biosynthesis